MPELWVPGRVADGLIAEREGQAEARRVLGDFRNRLKAIDPRLDLFLCDRHEEIEGELRYGYWYIYRRNEDGTVAAWQVKNPDGSYREPDEAVLEAFKRGDANRHRDPARQREAERRRERALREQRKQSAKDDRLYRLQEQAAFKFRLQVPANPAQRFKRKRTDKAA